MPLSERSKASELARQASELQVALRELALNLRSSTTALQPCKLFKK